MGAVIVVGVVVVGVAIKEALDAYELRGSSSEEVAPAPQTKHAPQETSTNRKPKPEPSGQDGFPPVPPEPVERERRPECRPVPVPHRGGNAPHNDCADLIPQNSFPGWDVLVNGKQFDALVLVTRTLWDSKTDNFVVLTRWSNLLTFGSLSMLPHSRATMFDPVRSSTGWNGRFRVCAWDGRLLKRKILLPCLTAMNGSRQTGRTAGFRSYATMTMIIL